MKDLGILKGDACDAAWGINSKTQVIGDSGSCSNGPVRPFLWENGSIYDLSTVFPPGRFQAAEAHFINDHGEIAGNAVLQNGDTHAYLLIPCDDNHNDGGDCEELAEGATATAQSSSAPITQNPTTMTEGSSSTNERTGAARGRLGRRYQLRGFGTYQPK